MWHVLIETESFHQPERNAIELELAQAAYNGEEWDKSNE
jgi:hypothetical protein